MPAEQWIPVIHPDGREVEVPAGEVQAALQQGYRLSAGRGKGAMAVQAMGETLREPLPGGVGGLVEKLRGGAGIAERLGAMGVPSPISALAASQVAIPAELLPRTGLELALTGLAGPATEAVGAAGKAVIRKASPFLISEATGIARPIVERALRVRAALRTPVDEYAIRGFVDGLVESMKQARSDIGQRLGAVAEQIAARLPKKSVPTADIAANLETKLSRSGFKIPNQAPEDVAAAVRQVQSDTTEIIKDLRNLNAPAKPSGLLTPGGKPVPIEAPAPQATSFMRALNIRRKMDDVLEFISSGDARVGTAEKGYLKEARASLNDRLRAFDPRFRQANDAAAALMQKYQAIQKDFLSGKQDMVERRLANMFKKGTVERRAIEQADFVSKAAGKQIENILNQITAQQFKPALRPGMGVRPMLATGGGLVSGALRLGSAGSVPGALATGAATAAAGLTISSPRFNALVIKTAQNLTELLGREVTRAESLNFLSRGLPALSGQAVSAGARNP